MIQTTAMPFWVLTAFLIFTFLTGGGSRADTQSLMVLRPAAIIVCATALWTLRWEHINAYQTLFWIAIAVFGLVLLHLIPLPPSLWAMIPGRALVSEIDKVAGLGAVWRPISLVPAASWNAFYSLFVPLAVLLLGVQLTREALFKLISIILCIGVLSGLLGLIQTVGSPSGPLYFYNITNNGSAVGLFANRNHQATFLATLFPMLAVYAATGALSEQRVKINSWVALAMGCVLIPLMLVTGSRAGLILGVIGLASILLLYSKPIITVAKKRKGEGFDYRWLIGGFAVLCLGALTVMMSRAQAFERLAAPDQSEDLRFSIWGPIAEMGWKYFPFGSGIGSFVEIYQIDEPYALLNTSYVNHAHNDWLEIFMTAGLPGMIILAVVGFQIIKRAYGSFTTPRRESRSIIFSRLGAVIIFILALGSLGDYPLRTPSLACVFVIAMLWLFGNRGTQAKNTGNT